MDYEKKYNDALNLAKSYYGKGSNEFLDTIFPELAESEDERIRKGLVKLLTDASKTFLIETTSIEKASYLAYLEKQKESLHIQETCKENADSFTDCIIEVRSFQRGMEEGRRLEKQKEQEHICDSAQYDEGFKTGREVGFREGVESVKPAEWSKEDQNNVNVLLSIIGEVREMRMQNTLVGPVETVERKRRFDKLEAWLKALRPQPHWKPSEEQLDMLCRVCSTLHLTSGENKILESLYKDLYKLGVKEEPEYYQHFDSDC